VFTGQEKLKRLDYRRITTITNASFFLPLSASTVMTKPKITPDVVKTIESALEERKKGTDRRNKKADNFNGSDRRSGDDRRDKK
jgi:hypothetical protein